MLSETELKEIHGGTSTGLILGIVGYAITFIIGIFDGYYRPLGC